MLVYRGKTHRKNEAKSYQLRKFYNFRNKLFRSFGIVDEVADQSNPMIGSIALFEHFHSLLLFRRFWELLEEEIWSGHEKKTKLVCDLKWKPSRRKKSKYAKQKQQHMRRRWSSAPCTLCTSCTFRQRWGSGFAAADKGKNLERKDDCW